MPGACTAGPQRAHRRGHRSSPKDVPAAGETPQRHRSHGQGTCAWRGTPAYPAVVRRLLPPPHRRGAEPGAAGIVAPGTQSLAGGCGSVGADRSGPLPGRRRRSPPRPASGRSTGHTPPCGPRRRQRVARTGRECGRPAAHERQGLDPAPAPKSRRRPSGRCPRHPSDTDRRAAALRGRHRRLASGLSHLAAPGGYRQRQDGSVFAPDRARACRPAVKACCWCRRSASRPN